MYTSVPPALISASLLALAGLFGGVSISFFGNHSAYISIVSSLQALYLVESVWVPP